MKKIIKKILEIFRLLNLYYKIEDLVNPLKKKNRKNISNKIFIILHCPRSGGSYLKNIIKFYFGNLHENNNFDKVTIPNIYYKPIFIFGHQVHNDFDEYFEDKIKRFILIRKPNERIISRYFYLKNYSYFKNINDLKENFIFNSNINLSDYIKIIKDSYNDNFLTRMLIGKINKNNFELNYKKNENKFQELNLDDFNQAIHNLKKYSIINVNKKDIRKFINYELGLSDISGFEKKWKYVNYYNKSLKNEKISKSDIDELNKINFYDNKIYNLRKHFRVKKNEHSRSP